MNIKEDNINIKLEMEILVIDLEEDDGNLRSDTVGSAIDTNNRIETEIQKEPMEDDVQLGESSATDAADFTRVSFLKYVCQNRIVDYFNTFFTFPGSAAGL